MGKQDKEETKMKTKRLSTLVLSLPLILSLTGFEVRAEGGKIGSFDILSNTGCTIEQNKLTTTNGSFLLKDSSSITEDFSLTFNMKATGNADSTYGIVLYGNEAEGKLSGNVFRPFYSGSSWQMAYGTLKDDEYSQISVTSMDFGNNFQGNFAFYVSNGVAALRMDGWCIGTYDLYYTEGVSYFYGSGSQITLDSPLTQTLQHSIGNYMYRDQWGGLNVHGFTTCFNNGATHSFKMNLPTSVNKADITKLYLVRGSVQRNYGQKAHVKINGSTMPDWENMDQTNHVNGSVDTYSDAVYEIPLETIASTKELAFEINNIDGEYVSRGYKLIYETSKGKFLADKMISGSSLSENEHEFSFSAKGWTGSQYLFLDVGANQNGHNIFHLGNKENAKVKMMNNFSYWKASDISLTFTDRLPIEVDFFDYLHPGDAFSYTNEIWFNSTKVGDGHVLQLDNANRDVRYTIDFYISGLDVSGGETKKVSQSANLKTVGYEAEDAGEIINVETDINGMVKDGFIKTFNSLASRKFELGTSKEGASLSYTFTGSFLSIYGYKGRAGGKIKVEIDDASQGEFDTYADSDKYQTTIAKITSLENKTHTLKISNVDGKWTAIDFIQFEISKEAYYKRFNLAQVGEITCSNPNPRGGGNKDLNVIRDEKIAPIGSNGLGPTQYDSFDGSGKLENTFYMGYTFQQDMKVGKLCYQAGCTWATGGWFKDGTIHVEALIDGSWTTLELLEEVDYPNANTQDAFIPNNIYIFKFNQITCRGIRIIGSAGGSEHFVSVSEIEVYQSAEAKSFCEGASYRDAIEF